MSGLIRQGHFLGAKLRALRKRNGLTLDELSARCVQIDAQPVGCDPRHARGNLQQGCPLVS
jgi:hypothetical protein